MGHQLWYSMDEEVRMRVGDRNPDHGEGWH